jgi:hypothetical protein
VTVGKITRVPLREVWAHEALDFTTWLERNVDVLNEVLDFNLVSAEREKAAGDFSVDLVGEDEDGNTVVVENQLEPSDHRHLGQVLTYLAAMDAKAAVWIVGRARPEHTQAVAWLNQSTAADFYLVQLEAIRIGDSAAAPLFTRIVGPSAEARAVGAKKREFSERDEVRREFWELLIEHAAGRTDLHARCTTTTASWIQATASIPGLKWDYAVRAHDMRVELYMDRSEPEETQAIYEGLHGRKDEIEAAFGHALEWERREGRRSCKVWYGLSGGGLDDRDRWPSIVNGAVDAMVRLEAAMREPLEQVRIEVLGR